MNFRIRTASNLIWCAHLGGRIEMSVWSATMIKVFTDGGEPKSLTFSNLNAIFHHPKIVKLEQNYRSTNAILGAANSIIRHNPRRRPKSLWSENGDGQLIRLVQVPDDREEANYVVGEIQKQQLAEQCSWTEFAVIFRMNAQSRLIEENFRRLHIPYRVVGGHSFFERREVKDLLAYLSCLVNPQDDVSLLRIINTPARGIGATHDRISYSGK